MTTILVIKATKGIFVTREVSIFQVSVGVAEVKIKTGTEPYASTDATPFLEICDGLGTCCKTLGLDNSGDDRSSGQIDVYQDSWLLDSCNKVDYIIRGL